MECKFNRTPYKRRLENYSELKHFTASMQPRKYSEDNFKMKLERTLKHLQRYSESYGTRLRRARGLVRPETTELRTWHIYFRIRDGTWLIPYNGCNCSYRSRTSRNSKLSE
jgi:hypothetical protein